MKSIWTVIVCVLILACSNSNEYRTIEYDNGAYPFDNEILAKVKKDTVPWRFQISASEFAMKSEYFKALNQWDTAVPARNIELEDTYRDSIETNYSTRKAQDYILDQAASNTILILNEAHHNSSHRMFARTLLEGLYERGYRYFGVEGLGNGEFLDDSLNQRKYPIRESGYYTKDPQFGNLLRDALKLGFHVFAYEKTGETQGPEGREAKQARHIADVIDKHPGEKVFIYCGFDHVLEGIHPSWTKAMAERLKDLTGINPLTVDQVQYSEKSKPSFSSALVQAVNPNKPVVLLDGDGNVVPYKSLEVYSDIAIIHPFSKEQNGRANWLYENFNKLVDFEIPNGDLSYPLMVLAFVENEDIHTAIPYDIIELDSEKSNTALALSPGKYNIVLISKDSGSAQFTYICE